VISEASAPSEVKTFDLEIPRQGGALLARVYQPQGPGPFPILLDVHGGAWSRGDRTTDEALDTRFAESGLLVVSPEIRIGPKDPYPGQLQDINLATRWLKVHGATLNGDPSSVGGVGFSSGGHSVVLSAMLPRDPSFQALPLAGAEQQDGSLAYVISMWPVIDPYARYTWAISQNNPHFVAMHDGFFLSIKTMLEANPLLMLERGEQAAFPPLLLLHGTADDIVPIDLVKRFAKRWQEAGGEVSLEEFEGEPHGFGREPGPVRDRMLAVSTRFIRHSLAGKVAV
jgi:acetyl esterase/lipase